MDIDNPRTVVLNDQSIELILELVREANALELLTSVRAHERPSTRMVSLTRLEMELIAAKNGRQ